MFLTAYLDSDTEFGVSTDLPLNSKKVRFNLSIAYEKGDLEIYMTPEQAKELSWAIQGVLARMDPMASWREQQAAKA